MKKALGIIGGILGTIFAFFIFVLLMACKDIAEQSKNDLYHMYY